MKDKKLLISIIIVFIILLLACGLFYIKVKQEKIDIKTKSEFYLACDVTYSDSSKDLKAYVINLNEGTIYDAISGYYLGGEIGQYNIEISHSEKLSDKIMRMTALTINRINGQISGWESFQIKDVKKSNSTTVHGICTPYNNLKF